MKKHSDNLLGITAIILANLCVATRTSMPGPDAKNRAEEERMAYHQPDQNFHLAS